MKKLKNEAIMNTDEFLKNYIIARPLKFITRSAIQRSAAFDQDTHDITESYCM